MTYYPAIQLFIERAQEADPHFALTNDNAAAITEICRRLDGLPLAIELAAARTRLLPPQDLLQRLAGAAGRMPLLTGGPRDVPPRQQTLRNTMAWSYELLSEAEKTLFRRLAVFVGGWTLEAAEAICDLHLPLDDAPAINGDPIINRKSPLVQILDNLDSLVDKSLVRRAPSAEPRFTMLETVREYAQERLAESGETDALRRRHAQFYLKLAETASPGLRGPRQVAWINRLEAEHDNLRASLDWCLAADEPALAVRFAAALFWFWILHGYTSEGRQRIEAALQAMSNATAPAGGWSPTLLAARARALEGAARLATAKAKIKVAHDRIDESLAIWRQLGDKRGIAQALRFQANVYHSLSQDERRRLLKESRLLYEEAGDEWGLADAMLGLADIAANAKDYGRAAMLFDESQKVFERLGDRLGVGWVQKSRAHMLYYKGDYPAARVAYEQALEIFHAIGDRSNIGGIWNMQGELARTMGDYAHALACYQHAYTAYAAVGREWNLDVVDINLGYVALHAGDVQQAARLFHKTLLNYRKRGETDDTCLILGAIAGLAGCASTRVGDRAMVLEAARLLGGVAGRLDAISFSLDPADQMVFDLSRETVRAWLGNADFEMAWFAGRAMPLAQTMEAAMNTVLQWDGARV